MFRTMLFPTVWQHSTRRYQIPHPKRTADRKNESNQKSFLILRIRQPTSDLWRQRSTTADWFLAQLVPHVKYAGRAEDRDYAEDADKPGFCLSAQAEIWCCRVCCQVECRFNSSASMSHGEVVNPKLPKHLPRYQIERCEFPIIPYHCAASASKHAANKDRHRTDQTYVSHIEITVSGTTILDLVVAISLGIATFVVADVIVCRHHHHHQMWGHFATPSSSS